MKTDFHDQCWNYLVSNFNLTGTDIGVDSIEYIPRIMYRVHT